MTPKNIQKKRAQAERRAIRTRAKISGTTERPRLSIFRSSKHMSAQVIDDTKGKTLASASDLKMDAKKTGLELAAMVGQEVAAKAKAAGITKVVFDKGQFRFHGRVKALAEAAREGGLVF
ncbi:MAG: 50S ribosomal protein L18 [Patescibacteria group bacterium]|jgi:large subunit ribosomal protein L18